MVKACPSNACDGSVWRACQQLLPLLRIKSQRELALPPVHQRAFDDTMLRQHQGFGAGIVRYAGLHRRIQPPPSSAPAIDQRIAPQLLQPCVQAISWHAPLFKVVPFVSHLMFLQPGARFFHRIAMGNTVNRNRCSQ